MTFVPLAAAGVTYVLLQSLVAPALPDMSNATPLIGRLGHLCGKERLLVVVVVLVLEAAAVATSRG